LRFFAMILRPAGRLLLRVGLLGAVLVAMA
jgi:hypothetical protein